MKFDVLEIQKNIEEKRLILGAKFEQILQQKIFKIFAFLKRIISHKTTPILGVAAIIFLSIFLQSSRDLGHDSAVYLDIAKKFLAGGRYYFDFLEFNFPLGFLITTIPYKASLILGVDPIIVLEIFANLVGILAIFSGAKILQRAEISKDQLSLNLLILSFAYGFFLRAFTLQFNEIGTKTTYLFALLIPYFSYQFLAQNQLKKSDQVAMGTLAALMFALKPHYAIFAVIFELRKVFLANSLRVLFVLRNYVALGFAVLYLLLIAVFFPEFFQKIIHLSSLYLWRGQEYWLTLETVKYELLPAVFLVVFGRKIIQQNRALSLSVFGLAASLILILFEIIRGEDQLTVFYFWFLIFSSMLVLELARQGLINFRRDWILILSLLILPQFDEKFFELILGSYFLWWVFAIVVSSKWRKALRDFNFTWWQEIFLPHNIKSWLKFGLFVALTLPISISARVGVATAICSIFFVLMAFFYQQLHEKFYKTNELSRLSVSILVLCFAYFIHLNCGTFFPRSAHISPSYVNDQIAKITKTYSRSEDGVLFLSGTISGQYPILNYLKKDNHLPTFQLPFFFSRIVAKSAEISDEEMVILDRVKRELASDETKLVFVDEKNSAFENDCRIGLLEFYFRDAEFRKTFLKNYRFLTRITKRSTSNKTVEFFHDGVRIEIPWSPEFIDRDVDVYVRKNA